MLKALHLAGQEERRNIRIEVVETCRDAATDELVLQLAESFRGLGRKGAMELLCALSTLLLAQ